MDMMITRHQGREGLESTKMMAVWRQICTVMVDSRIS